MVEGAFISPASGRSPSSYQIADVRNATELPIILRLQLIVLHKLDFATGKGDIVHYSSPESSGNSNDWSAAAFRGRPRGRRLASKPRRRAVLSIHTELPNGRPRRRLSRSRSTSTSVCGSLTWRNQSAGRGTGPGSRTGSASTRAAALDQRQCSARSAWP